MNIQSVIKRAAFLLDHGKFADRQATPRQVRAVNIFLSDCKIKDRDDRLQALGFLVGKPITSSKDLTMGQASVIIYLSRNHQYKTILAEQVKVTQ